MTPCSQLLPNINEWERSKYLLIVISSGVKPPYLCRGLYASPMSRSIRRVLLSYILFSLLSWSLYAQGARHTLTGVVCDASTSEPIAYALVALSAEGYKDVVTYTDDEEE